MVFRLIFVLTGSSIVFAKLNQIILFNVGKIDSHYLIGFYVTEMRLNHLE